VRDRSAAQYTGKAYALVLSCCCLYEEHAAQLWKPAKVQSFFCERRYICYFVVQEEEAREKEQQQGEQQHSIEQQESERQVNYMQRLSLLSSSLEALKHEDSKAIDRIAEEASANDRTGWFKRIRWDEHLQAYPRLEATYVRCPTARRR
jgi:hypothetical protein